MLFLLYESGRLVVEARLINDVILNTLDWTKTQRATACNTQNENLTADQPRELEDEGFELDDETLRIISEEPSKNQKELDIHPSLANRWRPWLQDSLKKELRDELLIKYPRAGNCSLEPPVLNRELSILNSNILKKDKYFKFTQNLAGSALSAFAPVITNLVSLKTQESCGMQLN